MRTTGSREVYRNPWIRVREDELRARIRDGRFPDGPSVAGYGLLLLGR